MKIDDLSVKSINGEMKPMSDYSGKVLLIVNVASKCGFTKQYSGLQSLYEQYAAKGLIVLGFPCDQFGHQEPGEDQEIERFCQTQFSVTFPMFSKIDVNGHHASPLYKWLKSSQPGLLGTEAIKWNFTKFLVGRDGQVIKRYAPMQSPESLVPDIETALNEAE